jgi:hypothetical protein
MLVLGRSKFGWFSQMFRQSKADETIHLPVKWFSHCNGKLLKQKVGRVCLIIRMTGAANDADHDLFLDLNRSPGRGRRFQTSRSDLQVIFRAGRLDEVLNESGSDSAFHAWVSRSLGWEVAASNQQEGRMAAGFALLALSIAILVVLDFFLDGVWR